MRFSVYFVLLFVLQAQAHEGLEKWVVVLGQDLPIYATANPHSRLVETLKEGSICQLIETKKAKRNSDAPCEELDWHLISTPSGQAGWITGDRVFELDKEQPLLPDTFAFSGGGGGYRLYGIRSLQGGSCEQRTQLVFHNPTMNRFMPIGLRTRRIEWTQAKMEYKQPWLYLRENHVLEQRLDIESSYYDADAEGIFLTIWVVLADEEQAIKATIFVEFDSTDKEFEAFLRGVEGGE